MKMIFTGKVSGEKTVLAAGARHTVKAQAGEQYGLVDEVTGLVPDGVEADRTGDDLILRKKEDDTEIRIEGFWEKCQPGETQCTAVFNVVGENGQVTEAVLTQDGPVLENFTAGQSGTLAEGISNGIIWGGIAFGAGLAAIALLAGGGGGSSRHKSAAGEGQNQVQAEGSQETGKIDGPPTVSTKPVNGNSFGQVPEVNDQDGNGRADDLDAAVAAATAAVEAAEAADQAAKDKLAELNADNLITPEEKAQLEAAKQNADTLKEEANSAVQALPDTVAEKGDLQDRVDALDGIQVPEVNDQDGNGIPDFIDSQLAFFNKASSPNVSGDLYPNAPRFSWSTESNKISTVNKNWEGILNANPGAYVTREVISTNVEQYNYNGINGSDIISIKNSLFGLDRTQVDRQPVGLFTGEGNDIIVTGQDYGRNTSLGYTDHANITNMGGGDDTLVVGAGNNNVTLYVNDDGQLRATTDGYDGLYSINYNQINPGVTGGTISGTDISMGEGHDTILVLGTEGNTADAIINTNIDLGQGNDFIYINGNVSSAWNTSVNIRGNEGVDTLFIDNGDISSLQFSGFEVIKLGRNGGVNIREVDLLKSGADAIEGGDLKIIRDASSRVNLEGDFIQKGIETVEGVNYLVYSNDNTPGIRILVDTDIPLIM
ncbi:GA-like domain-containing protein [Escherichia coli]|uniref:GA-like domain-containing protein n=1 Tax=Escherichia coli TaxID=562 RepID=UPI0038B28A12